MIFDAIPVDDLVSFDAETYRIRPGNTAPRSVCWSFAYQDRSGFVEEAEPGLDRFERLLDGDPNVDLVGHNLAFDLVVASAARPRLVPKIFDALDRGRIFDTMLVERMASLADGTLDFDPVTRRPRRFGLVDVVLRYEGVDLSESKGPDAWRTHYAELDGVPLERWPEEAREYPESDAVHTRTVFRAQCRRLGGHPREVIPDVCRQVATAYCFGLASCHGMRTDAAAIDRIETELRRIVAEHRARLEAAEVLDFRGRKRMARIRELVEAAFDEGECPKTDKGATKTDTDTLLASGCPTLLELAAVQKPMSHLASTIPKLRLGVSHPITPRVFVLKSTGRVSYRDPNLQNLPRDGGFRECFVPRPGFAFVSADYTQCEMVCLAQACIDLGTGEIMANAIRAGIDLHAIVGAQLLGIDLADFDKTIPEHAHARQIAKVSNFGLPGGMGVATFRVALNKAGFGPEVDASAVVEAWRRAWPDVVAYLQLVGQWCQGGQGTVIQIRSGRVRAGCTYTQAANSPFQGLAADLMFDAFRRIQREAYTDRASPLWGTRVVAVVHDEILAEVPLALVDPAARRLSKHMLDAGSDWTPDVPHRVIPVALTRWSKVDDPLFDEDGRLVPHRIPLPGV